MRGCRVGTRIEVASGGGEPMRDARSRTEAFTCAAPNSCCAEEEKPSSPQNKSRRAARASLVSLSSRAGKDEGRSRRAARPPEEVGGAQAEDILQNGSASKLCTSRGAARGGGRPRQDALSSSTGRALRRRVLTSSACRRPCLLLAEDLRAPGVGGHAPPWPCGPASGSVLLSRALSTRAR